MAIVAVVLAACGLIAAVLLYLHPAIDLTPSIIFGALGAAILSFFVTRFASQRIEISKGILTGRKLVVASWVLIGILVVWIVVGPAFTPPRGHHVGKTVDANKLRQIGQASLIYANDNREVLPPTVLSENGEKRTASIHDVARLLAQQGGINDASIWFSRRDKAVPRNLLQNQTTGETKPSPEIYCRIKPL